MVVFGSIPGHFALRIEFPDGFVAYLDNGWAGTGGIFTFAAGGGIPTPKKPMHGEVPTQGGEPGWRR